MKKNCLILILLLVTSISIVAQENNRSQWFISGGAHGVAALNGAATNSLGGKVSAGVWINDYTGFRLNAEASHLWLKGDYTGTTFGAGLDWMVNLLSIAPFDPDRKFFLYSFIGIGYNHYSLDKDYNRRYSRINDIVGNFSIQAAFKLSDRVSLFLEPGIRMNPKFYDIDNKDDAYASGMVTAGITFKL
ncbi:MAG: porin family protein [Bacteroides sp.]|nr:porin family protein [Bacteroides sp.]